MILFAWGRTDCAVADAYGDAAHAPRRIPATALKQLAKTQWAAARRERAHGGSRAAGIVGPRGRYAVRRVASGTRAVPISDVAEDDHCRRRHLLVRLERVERALRRGDTWESNALLPAELRRPGVQPILHREDMDNLQRLLTDELARLDGAGAA
jgi:hypothetical protein